ncbi:parvalbumin, muscle-like [Ranitomeya variabilis]|uniref:parvalbumin, muscle-like n=1 Tax=Ranitomeya variabilis TaxID=490064 RepID=UPI004055E2D7
MSKMTDVLNAADMQKATRSFETIRFDFSNYTKLVGLTEKSRAVQLHVFSLLQYPKPGYLDEKDARHMMQSFSPGARELTDQETKDFLSAGGEKGKISADDFIAMIAKA